MTDSLLKSGTIIQAGSLDPWTTQYVLKNAVAIGGLPEAGSQGKHRSFTLSQAVRLAVHTQLVMAGVILESAVKAMRYCDKIVKDYSRKRDVSYVFEEAPKHSWLITIQDSRYVNVWSDYLAYKARKIENPSSRVLVQEIKHQFYDTKTDELVNFGDDQPLTCFTLDATLLERRLAKAIIS